MNVVAQSRNSIDRLDNVPPKISGMRGRKPNSPDAGNLAHCSQQFSERLLPCRIFVRIHILSQQLNFGIAEVGHLPSFRQYRIRRPAALLAARERDYAVGAELVATFNDGDVSAMRVGARRELSLEAFVSFAVVQSGDTLLPCFNLDQHFRQVSIRRRAADQRNIRRALENLFAFLLRYASQHAEALALLIKFLV